jgi:hypothetical protein
VTKSVEINCNKFIIQELEGYQLRHQFDLISYLPIEPIDHDRDDSRAHTSTRVALLALPMPSPILEISSILIPQAQLKLAVHQRGSQNHANVTSIHITDGS